MANNYKGGWRRLRVLLEKLWTYAVEVIAATVFSVILWHFLGWKAIGAWQVEKRADLVASIAVAGGSCAAIFAAFFAMLSTDFGKKLRVHGVAAEYTSAFAFPLILLVVTAAVLEFLTKKSGWKFVGIVTFLLCYSALNCINMVKNVTGLVKLWQDLES